MNPNTVQMLLNQMATAISMYPTDSLWIKAIPAVISVFNELVIFYDAREVEGRLSELERKIEELEIQRDDFTERLNSLEIHDKFVFRNYLKHYCLETLPEVTEPMIYALIDFVMSQGAGLREELCEILSQFNAIDIECMKRIKDIVNDEDITKKRRDETIKKIEEQTYKNWKDWIEYSPGRTVIWEDFIGIKIRSTDECGNIVERIPSVNELMKEKYKNESENGIYLSYYARSIIKLQNLGILITYNQSYIGAAPAYSIKQFMLTNYGVKLLDYVK